MSLAKAIFVAAVAVALTAYSVDCGAMTTADEAMECCKSMACPSHGHDSQDCCKTMPAMHAPFVQPSSVHTISFSPAIFAVLPASSNCNSLDTSTRVIAAHCHAPPVFYSPAPRPLRV